MNRTRPVTFEPLEYRELFAADIGFCNSVTDQAMFQRDGNVPGLIAQSRVQQHEPSMRDGHSRIDGGLGASNQRDPLVRFTDFLPAVGFKDRASPTMRGSSFAEGESNIPGGLPVTGTVTQPPATISFVVREVLVVPVFAISTRSPQSGIALVSRSSNLSEQRNAPRSTVLNAASMNFIAPPAGTEIKSISLTTSHTQASTSESSNRSVLPNHVWNSTTNDHNSADSISALNEVSSPTPSDMVSLRLDDLSAWNRLGIEKAAKDSSSTDRSRPWRPMPRVESTLATSRVLSIARPDSPLPIPADMVYLDINTCPNPTSSNVDYLFGEIGMNPLALFQTFLHSQPIEVEQTHETSAMDLESDSVDSKGNNPFSSISVGIVAVASAVFFAFSPRKHRSLKLNSPVRRSEPNA